MEIDEIDTTGLERPDEITRFPLVDARGQMLENCLIRSALRKPGPQASAINQWDQT